MKLQELSKEIATLETLGLKIYGIIPEVRGAMSLALKGSLAIGALVHAYSKREDVQEEIKKANAGKRGRPYTPHGYVAEKLETTFGKDMPGRIWLTACANASERALAMGSYKGGVMGLLDYRSKEGIEFAANSIPLPNLQPALPGPDGDEDPSDPADPDIEALLANTGKALSKKILSLIVKTQAAKKRLSPKAWEKVFTPVNQELQRIGYAIARRG